MSLYVFHIYALLSCLHKSFTHVIVLFFKGFIYLFEIDREQERECGGGVGRAEVEGEAHSLLSGETDRGGRG